MALSAPAGFASSDLVYQENFSGTALGSDWHTYITSNAANGWPWNTNGSGGSTPGGPYNADYDVPSQVSVSNGALDLTAIQQPVSGMNQGGTPQTFPVTSGAVSSYGNVEFNGGYLQISMKAPSGDGAWPGLWLMPGKGAGTSGDNFELDIQEGGFTGSGPTNQAFAWHLHTPSGTVGNVVDSGVDLTAGFHTYGINWVPGQSITWYLDGKQMAQVTSAQVPIPNEPMQLIMNNGVANSNASGWHTALDGSTPSSMQMQVNGIQLYQKAGSGDSITGANVTAPTTPTVQPAVTQATASPGTGTEHVGDTVSLTLGFNEAVTVTGTPTLSLNDGATATYVGGSGTGALTFRTTVASTDTNTSALAITRVNLPSGASIKDASGVAANLSGAVKTFSGLQVATSPTAPTTPTTPTTPITPSSIAPVLTIADPTLWVNGRGGTVALGVKVTTTDPNDVVTVNMTGLPRYESITDKLDGQTFTGNNVTLTAAQVDSGLTLQSNYRGGGHPAATLTLTATAKDPVTGAVATAAPQTIAVTDPRPTATTATSPQTITPTHPHHAPSLATQGSALLNEDKDLVAGATRTLAPQNIAMDDHLLAAGATTASLASQSFALLNQYLAGDCGRADPGQIVSSLSNGGNWNQDSFLTRPQH